MRLKFYSIIILTLLVVVSACVFEKQLDPVAKLESPSYVTVLKNPQAIPSNARWYMPDIYYYISDDVKSYSTVVNQVFKEYNDAGSLRFFATSQKDSADIFIEFADLGTIPEKTTIGLLPQKYETFEGFQLANYTVEIGEIDFPELFRATIQLNKNWGNRWNKEVVKSTLLYQIGKIMGLTDSNSPISALQKQINISKPITVLSLEDKSRFKAIYDVRENQKWEEKTLNLPLNIYEGVPGRIIKDYINLFSVGNQTYLILNSTIYKYDVTSNQFSPITSTNAGAIFSFDNAVHSYDGKILYRLNGSQWEKRANITVNNSLLTTFFYTETLNSSNNSYEITRARYFPIKNKLYSIYSYEYFSSVSYSLNEIDLLNGQTNRIKPPLYIFPYKMADEIKPFGNYMIFYTDGNYILFDPIQNKWEYIGKFRRDQIAEYPSTFFFGINNRIYFANVLQQSGKYEMAFTYQSFNPFNKRYSQAFSLGTSYSTHISVFNLYKGSYEVNLTPPCFYSFNSGTNGYIIRNGNGYGPAQNYLLTFTPHKTFSKM